MGPALAPYLTKTETLSIGGFDYRIRSLLDSNQFDDPDGLALAAGVSEESWSFFGLVWASGLRLAEVVSARDLGGRRILEIGCGLALAGIVSQRRKADVTASDRHPLASPFLAANLLLNGLPPMPYVDVDWARPPARLGRFDLILASDVLYDAAHPGELARFLDTHLMPGGEVVVVDPGRNLAGRFGRELASIGLGCVDDEGTVGTRIRVRTYRDGSAINRP